MTKRDDILVSIANWFLRRTSQDYYDRLVAVTALGIRSAYGPEAEENYLTRRNVSPTVLHMVRK